METAAVDVPAPWEDCSAWPCRWPALAAAWLLAFAVALGELGATILVAPPGVSTLSILIFGLLHYGVQDRVAGLCLALLALSSAVLAAAAALLWFWYRRGRNYN